MNGTLRQRLLLLSFCILVGFSTNTADEKTCTNKDDPSCSAEEEDGGGSVWTIPSDVMGKAKASMKKSRRGLGTRIRSNAISDPKLLQALTNHEQWFACYENTRGSNTHWMDWDAKPRNLMERVAVHLWSQEPLVENSTFAGYEIWCNILTPEGPLGWHVDKDQIYHERTGKVKLPYFGSVYYGYPHEFEGGYLELTNYDTENDKASDYTYDDGIERISAEYNRWIVFNASKFHRVSPVTKGARVTLAVNLWKERPLVAELRK